uniref:Uncharacterized protein n=1 Tax=Ailuropoda melanoleuca TaxID=9646 RepID=D2IDZ6_AILME|nr:hypothetical protein [Ailuropoda melanoleuca]
MAQIRNLPAMSFTPRGQNVKDFQFDHNPLAQGKEEARKGYVSFCWVSVVDIRQLGSGAGGDSSKFLSIYGLHRFISWRGGDIIISLNLRDTDSYVLNSYLAVPDDSDRRRESRLFLNTELKPMPNIHAKEQALGPQPRVLITNRHTRDLSVQGGGQRAAFSVSVSDSKKPHINDQRLFSSSSKRTYQQGLLHFNPFQ